MIQLAGQVVPVKLNAEKSGREAANKYKVRGFPTILFISPSGQIEGKIGGYMPPEGFSQEMEKYITAYRDLPKMEARIKANPGDTQAAAKLASIYAGRGDIQRAEAMLKVAEKDTSSPLLAKAYNAVADHYQLSNQFEKAVPLFEKGIKTGKTSYDIAYSRISIAACRFSENKPKEAIPVLEDLVKMPDCPKEFKEQGQQMLQAAKQAR